VKGVGNFKGTIKEGLKNEQDIYDGLKLEVTSEEVG